MAVISGLFLFTPAVWWNPHACYAITNLRAIAFIPSWQRRYRLFVNLPEDLEGARCWTLPGDFGFPVRPSLSA